MSLTTSRWSNDDNSNSLETKVKKILFSKYIEITDSVISAIESEVKINNLESDLADLMFKGASVENLRSALGGMRNSIKTMLDKQGVHWDVHWNDNIEASMPTNVKFAIEVLCETAHRAHSSAIDDFTTRWNFLNTKRKGQPWDNPFDIEKLARIYYLAQLDNKIAPTLQTMIFLQLEQEILGSLNFVLFDLNSLLSDSGIRSDLDISNTDNIISKKDDNFKMMGDIPEINDEALFDSLCELLETWEPGETRDDKINIYMDEEYKRVVGEKKQLSGQEIFASIATLQKWVPKVLEDALGQPDGRLAHHIKESLIKQAEALGAPEGQTTIGADEEAAVDMVDRVFTQNLYERKMQRASRSVLAQILFPSVKAAILNRNWFSEDNHPAKEFIKEVTKVCSPLDENPKEEFVKKASETVDRLIAGFNEDVSIFQTLTKELHDFVDQRNKDTSSVHKNKIRDEKLKLDIKNEINKKWTMLNTPEPVRDFCTYLAIEYLFVLEKESARGTSKWDSAISTLESLMLLKSKKNDRVMIDGVLRDGLMKMLTTCGWTGVRAHGRLAEQEDYIHAYYALGKTSFEKTDYFDLQKVLDKEIAQTKDAKIQADKKLSDHALSSNDLIDFSMPISSSTNILNTNNVFIPSDYKDLEDTSEMKDHVDSMIKDWTDQIDASQANDGKRQTSKEEHDSLLKPNFNSHKPEVRLERTTQTILAEPDVEINTDQLEMQEDATMSSISSDPIFMTITQLSIGDLSTWIDDEDNSTVIKLSWISPISMKYLFVNKLGSRVLVATPKELVVFAQKGRFFPNVTPKDD